MINILLPHSHFGVIALQDVLAIIKQYLDDGKGFELGFEGDTPVLSDVKGISKLEISKGEMRGLPIRKGGKKKILEDQKSIILNASRVLIGNKVPFKVTVGSKEATIRFDLDHYVHMYPDRCVVVGFNNLEEHPLSFIKEYLSNYPNLKLLTPKR
ncbi:MAG: hypothetical protein QXT73_04360 [Candidatus Methanomethylicaceae archaeon]